MQSFQLLAFTGLGFYIMRKKLTPEAKINLDFDYFYRLFGRAFLAFCRRPVEAVDNIWTEVYARIGLRGLMGTARGAAIFDREDIDRAVDGTAYSMMRLGKNITRIQTGNIQDYLATAAFIALIIFALVFFA